MSRTARDSYGLSWLACDVAANEVVTNAALLREALARAGRLVMVITFATPPTSGDHDTFVLRSLGLCRPGHCK